MSSTCEQNISSECYILILTHKNSPSKPSVTLWELVPYRQTQQEDFAGLRLNYVFLPERLLITASSEGRSHDNIFAPFDTLAGFDKCINSKTVQYVENRILSESEKDTLSERLFLLHTLSNGRAVRMN